MNLITKYEIPDMLAFTKPCCLPGRVWAAIRKNVTALIDSFNVRYSHISHLPGDGLYSPITASGVSNLQTRGHAVPRESGTAG